MTQADAPLTTWSLRRQLLVGILMPVLLFIGFHSWSLYEESLESLHTAYDRTLLASAKSISEQLDVTGYDDYADIRATVPYSALEIFEADNQSRLFYRVSTQSGQMISGFAELPMWRGQIPQRPPYAALVDFYDDVFRGDAVRVAVLLQPVASAQGRGMAVIQVAETLELRHALALQLLRNTLWRHAVLIGLVVLTVMVVVLRVTLPVRQISQAMATRKQTDLTPLNTPAVPHELRPLVQATNHIMQRLQRLLQHQKRFVRDASHQLRTPLAVLKTQVQSARRGDIPAAEALQDMEMTVDRATRLANQMLVLAKVEQLRQQLPANNLVRWDHIAREVALDLAPLAAHKNLDFEVQADLPIPMLAPEWMLRELTRNLLHNAIHYAPPHSPLQLRLTLEKKEAREWAHLCIQDAGPGISPALRTRLFEPFSAGDVRTGSGLGLAICQEIVHTLNGVIHLENRTPSGLHTIAGLDAQVRLPLTPQV